MARIEVLRWAEVEAVDFERYATSVDGLAWTGSAFRVNSEEPAVLRAAELLKAAITARTPCFGSCWGLQLVASRLGGKVEPAAQGPQVKIEKEISATANGRNHPLLSGKAERFQAVHIHDDEITELHAAAGVQPIDRGRGRDYPPRPVPARAKKCAAMDGMIEEATEIMSEAETDVVRDAGMLAAAQAVEHYEISRYGTLKAWAEKLGLDDAVQLLDETLNEEKATDEKLTELADSEVNVEADEAEEREEAEEAEEADSGKREARTRSKARVGSRS